MAVFNPNVPGTSDPNYLGYSRGISQPQPDRSLETLFSGIGDVVSGAVNTGVDYVRRQIASEVHDKVDAEQSDYKAALQAADMIVRSKAGKAGVPSAAGTQALSYAEDGSDKTLVMQADDTDVPGTLQGLGSNIGTLMAARANNKLSETAYYGRLDALAKDMRSRYPGFRDYIDSQFEKATGVNAANAYIKSMLSDINTFMSKQTDPNDDKKAMLSELRKYPQLPGVPETYDALLHDKITTTDAMRDLNKKLFHKYDLDIKRAEREERQGSRKDYNEDITDMADRAVGQMVSDGLNSVATIGGYTPTKVADLMQKAASGQLNLDDTQAKEFGTYLRSLRDRVYRQAWDELNKPGPNGSKPWATTIGADATRQLINNKLAIFEEMSTSIYHKDFGLANFHKEANEAIANDTKYGLFKDVNMGWIFRQSAAINAMGDAFAKPFFEHILKMNFDGDFKTWLATRDMKLTVQPDWRQGGDVFTLKKAIAEAQANKIKLPEAYNEFVSQIEKIPDAATPMETKVALARAAFDPENQGIISKFARESRDPQTGRETKGQYSLFQRLSSEDMAKTIYDMRGKYPEIWANYKSWVESTFGGELFRREVNDLKDIQSMNKDMYLSWDDQNNRFGITYKGQSNWNLSEGYKRLSQVNTPLPPGELQPVVEAARTINRLNGGLQSVSTISKMTGENTTEYLLKTLIDQGYSPLSDKGSNLVLGIPDQMIRALVSSRQKQLLKEEELRNKYRKPAQE